MATPKKNNSSKIIKLPTDFTGVSGQQLSRDEIRSRKKKRLKRWEKLFEIKNYFEKKMGKSIYSVLPGVVENTFEL